MLQAKSCSFSATIRQWTLVPVQWDVFLLILSGSEQTENVVSEKPSINALFLEKGASRF